MHLTHLLLSLTLAGPPPADLPPPPSVGGAMLLAEGDPIAAAGVFEHLWSDTRDPTALVWAGLSRLRAGDAAHAVAYLGQALTLDLQPGLAASARRGLDDARRATRLVAVELHLHGDGPVLLALTRVDRAAPALSFQLSPHPGAQMLPISLDPGTWRVELRRGSRTVARTVGIDESSGPISLDEAIPAPSPPLHIRSFRLAGLISGGNLGLLGAGFLGFGLAHTNHNLDALAHDRCWRRADCRRDLAVSATWAAAGAGLLGAGLGLTTGALGTLLPTRRARRIAWTVDLGVGGTCIGIGLLGGLAGASLNRANSAGLLGPEIAAPITRFSTTAALLGLGLGLVGSASLGLALDRSDARRSARLRAHVTPGGLALAGNF